MHRRAFTILELVVTLLIIGVLVAIAAPRMSRAAEQSRFANCVSTFNAIARAAEYYRADRGTYPPDYVDNSSHALFRPYINTRTFTRPTPMGGYWDWNNRVNLSGNAVADWAVIGPNVSIAMTGPPLALWTEFDRYADDGSLTTGLFRRERTRFLLMRVPDVD
jgi:prepilin-type N-terminal cleavage/methylation domain-containing protein